MIGRLIEQSRFGVAISPQNISGTATTSPWLSMADFHRLQFVIQQGSWAGGTPAVTMSQAKTSSGGSSKALAFDTAYTNTKTSDVPTAVTVAAGTFNLGTVADTMVVIDIADQDLDVSAGFQFVQLAIASPGANADLLSASYTLYDPAFAGLPTSFRTALS